MRLADWSLFFRLVGWTLFFRDVFPKALYGIDG